LMKDLATLPKEERPAFGKVVNEQKQVLESHLEARDHVLKASELEARLAREALDLTLPGPYRTQGSRHPIDQVIREVVRILEKIGYAVRSGPQIEKDWYNFEALNMPPGHPAR